jgi:hypothetical protein
MEIIQRQRTFFQATKKPLRRAQKIHRTSLNHLIEGEDILKINELNKNLRQATGNLMEGLVQL